MKTYELGGLLAANTYPGRGIVVGCSANGKKAAFAYFIMGRSVNSRNRIFVAEGEDLRTEAHDPSLLSDPSLVIYNAVRKLGDRLIVTNGDQTDTIYDYVAAGKSFREALETRCFEPDAPNFTPRISAMATFAEGGFGYEMSILKSADEAGSACNRFHYAYAPVAGVGHFLHTYIGDGSPIPSFEGEPERVEIPDSIDAFAEMIWQNLNADNKISLFVRYVDLADGSAETRVINKNH